MTSHAPLRAAVYTRLSYSPDGSLETTDRQEADCRRVAERLGASIDEVFCDNNRSAWRRNVRRPGWEKLLEGIAAGRWDLIITYHGDRLMRQPRDLEELLTLECDVLIPAALEGQITVDNAGDVQARVIVEGANGPTTRDADRILEARGITVVPDILANAGGVVVSYFEWLQGLQGDRWSLEVVRARLQEMMAGAFTEVVETAGERDISLRKAAFIIAVDRVATAARMRGLAPRGC